MTGSNKIKKYRIVADELRDDVLSGKYSPGAAFPSVKMLCRRFGVSHLTAVKAIDTLRGMGLVRTRNGVGTFVARRMTKIGLVVPMMKQVEIFPPICQEISRFCQKMGVALDFVDDASKINREVLGIFTSANVPVVILDTDLAADAKERRFDFVGVDNFEIGQFAAQHVIERGARRLAFVSWDVFCDNVHRRLDGVASAVSRTPGAMIVDTYRWSCDEQSLAMAWTEDLPDAVICSSDLVAAHVLKLLVKIGRKCPDEVLVTGVNDVSLASLVSPSLTTVRQPCEAIARTAFETLQWRIENPDADKRRVMIAADLVVRESTTR